jgi:hypothetical protein
VHSDKCLNIIAMPVQLNLDKETVWKDFSKGDPIIVDWQK